MAGVVEGGSLSVMIVVGTMEEEVWHGERVVTMWMLSRLRTSMDVQDIPRNSIQCGWRTICAVFTSRPVVMWICRISSTDMKEMRSAPFVG